MTARARRWQPLPPDLLPSCRTCNAASELKKDTPQDSATG